MSFIGMQFSRKLTEVDFLSNAAFELATLQQEMWARDWEYYAHETRDSISLLSYAGCLGLSPSPMISAQFTLLNVCGSLKSRKKFTKNHILGVQGHRCWYPRKARQQCLAWLSVCNRSLARWDDSTRNRAFWRGYPILMQSCGLL